MDFEAYLTSKKIDSERFLNAEPDLWKNWKIEFDQIHPASFTAQKLYLINPIRRKYLLKQEPTKVVSATVEKPAEQQDESTPSTDQQVAKTPPKPAVPRPVFKPKPKTS